jgi:hypothetical protein
MKSILLTQQFEVIWEFRLWKIAPDCSPRRKQGFRQRPLLALRAATLVIPRLLVSVALFAFVTFAADQVDAATPQLSYILPPGVERGHEHVLTFTGARLADVEEVLFYHSGVTVKKIEAVDPQNVKVTVEVAPDCRLGEHLVQLRTRSGISDYRSFFVGALPPVEEKEPNSSFEEPQPIEGDVSVAGVLQNEDADYYRIKAAKGQRLSVEVEGIRLGQAFYDPFLAILDKDRFELASVDDTVLARQDCFLTVVVPEDGEYTILIRETSYRGADNCRYRLHVGNFPRPTVAYPAGGKRGEKLKVQFLGDAAGPIEREIEVPTDANALPQLDVQDEHGVTPSAVPFRLFSEGNVMEAEPNDAFESATAAELPLALNGRIEKPGDVDIFKFAAKQGQVWEIECHARRIGSPVDPVINIYNADKGHLAGNDDARGQDAYFRWQSPADGDYYLRINDHLGQGGDTYVYRVELAPVTPSLKLGIPRVDRYSQTRQTIVVPRGNRYGTLILGTRADFGGPLELKPDGLPAGISMTARPMHPSMNLMPVVFEAAEDAPVDGDLVDFRGKLADPNQPAVQVEGGFENLADFVLGEPNAAVYISGVANKLPVAVAEKVPFRLEIVQPKVPLVRSGTMNVKVLVHRDEGFDGAIYVQFPFTPPGVGATGAISIEKGQAEGLYPVNANGDAMLGKWPVMVIGAAEINGQAWVSSQLAELEVAEPYVTFALTRAACDKGQATQIPCKLTHTTAFEGNAQAQLIGLPPGVTADPVEFTKDTAELAFQVKTTGDTPVGNHKTPFCQVTITQNGEPIIGTVGTTELQVNEPPVAAAAPPPAAEPAPAAQAAAPPKPLSRLEQLRAQVQNQQAPKQ